MMALLFILFLFVYFIISLILVFTAWRKADQNNRKGWLAGLIVAFVMYNLVFWDWIPVVLKHKHYCKTDAGFWTYQSPEEWVNNNRKLSKQIWYAQGQRKVESLKRENGQETVRIWYGDNIYHEFEYDRNFAHAIKRIEQRLFDANAEKLLARSVQYTRGDSNLSLGANGFTDYKFWLSIGENKCLSDDSQEYLRAYKQYFDEFKKVAGVKGE